ncbi:MULTISPECIES: hypothetical protein [unclassified Duganella]|uniref:hypothetical protein n=1 Tax=unclassified Duganella TaxID=2636909 RepID=UPI000881F07E|nr:MULTISPECIES: hypothetical protein [unclassified Duganella]SDF80640.1 hypothetical protein SAMN05216320_1011381 [Duganella sp. OV458]SDI48656.1 hypothetical protein SAMN05428973_10134 [Duganella sp. OV510]
MHQRDRMRARCDEMGIHWARGNVASFAFNENGPYIQEWIDEFETAARDAAERKHLEIAKRNADAAEVSATAAVESAKTSGTSARAALFAAFVSLLALVVSVAAFFKQ